MRSVPANISKPDYYLSGDPESETASRYSQKIVIRSPEEISVGCFKRAIMRDCYAVIVSSQ